MIRSLIILFLALSLASAMVVLVYESAKAANRPPQTEQTRQQQETKKKKPSDSKKVSDKKEPILAQFMRKKLGASNIVLKGLMTDDFKEIEKGADALMKISLAEEWRISKDPTYARYSLMYQDTVRKLKTKATKENVDGVALTWMDVTMSCIECHDWVRNIMIAENDIKLERSAALAQVSEGWIIRGK